MAAYPLTSWCLCSAETKSGHITLPCWAPWSGEAKSGDIALALLGSLDTYPHALLGFGLDTQRPPNLPQKIPRLQHMLHRRCGNSSPSLQNTFTTR